MMVLESAGGPAGRILVRTISFQSSSPVWIITLASVDSPNSYRSDYRAQMGYSVNGGDTFATIFRIHDFDSVSPTQSQVAFESAPGVEWDFGGYGFNNLAIATDDPSIVAMGVGNYLAARAKFHVSGDYGSTWLASDDFPSESSYFGNHSSGVWCSYPKPGVTGTWYLLCKCGWDGPMYAYEIVGSDVPGASRVEVEPHIIEYRYFKVLASGLDSLGGLWFESDKPSGPSVPRSIFKGTIGAGVSLGGPFQTWPMIPVGASSPGVVESNQVKVYRGSWEDLGTPSLIATPSFLAPCGMDSSERWAVGGSGVAVDTGTVPPIIKYCGTGGETDGDWSDKTGNLHVLLDALGWTFVDVISINPSLGGE